MNLNADDYLSGGTDSVREYDSNSEIMSDVMDMLKLFDIFNELEESRNLIDPEIQLKLYKDLLIGMKQVYSRLDWYHEYNRKDFGFRAHLKPLCIHETEVFERVMDTVEKRIRNLSGEPEPSRAVRRRERLARVSRKSDSTLSN